MTIQSTHSYSNCVTLTDMGTGGDCSNNILISSTCHSYMTAVLVMCVCFYLFGRCKATCELSWRVTAVTARSSGERLLGPCLQNARCLWTLPLEIHRWMKSNRWLPVIWELQLNRKASFTLTHSGSHHGAKGSVRNHLPPCRTHSRTTPASVAACLPPQPLAQSPCTPPPPHRRPAAHDKRRWVINYSWNKETVF